MTETLNGLREAQHQTIMRGDMRCSALFSGDERYRYYLTRVWDPGKPLARLIGLNPSTATHEEDDPTIIRCMGHARRWGAGGIMMLNIFAYRATDPKQLRTVPDPVGPLNDYHLRCLGCDAWGIVVPCWGVHGKLYSRGETVREMLRRGTRDRLQVFGLTKDGYPKHPLYLRGDTKLVPWR